MIEPLFTSSAPLWTTVPPTGFALQAPMAMGNGPIAAPIFGPSTTPYSNAFSFVGRDFGSGLSAPALLAAIAMRRGQPQGPTNDQEVEDFIYDVLEVLPGAGRRGSPLRRRTRVAVWERAAQTPQARHR